MLNTISICMWCSARRQLKWNSMNFTDSFIAFFQRFRSFYSIFSFSSFPISFSAISFIFIYTACQAQHQRWMGYLEFFHFVCVNEYFINFMLFLKITHFKSTLDMNYVSVICIISAETVLFLMFFVTFHKVLNAYKHQ